jgi:hypothetical protein
MVADGGSSRGTTAKRRGKSAILALPGVATGRAAPAEPVISTEPAAITRAAHPC